MELSRDGFTFTETGSPNGVREVAKKHNVVGTVPFETGTSEPGVKSPLDRHTTGKQLVAETVFSYGFDDLFAEPEKDEPDLKLEWDDFFGGEPEKTVAKKIEAKVTTKSKRAAIADTFDSLFTDDPEPAVADEWDF